MKRYEACDDGSGVYFYDARKEKDLTTSDVEKILNKNAESFTFPTPNFTRLELEYAMKKVGYETKQGMYFKNLIKLLGLKENN